MIEKNIILKTYGKHKARACFSARGPTRAHRAIFSAFSGKVRILAKKLILAEIYDFRATGRRLLFCRSYF